MLAIDDSASIFWARETRGTLSMASTVSLRSASCCMSSGFCAGQMKLMSVLPGLISRISSGRRRAHLEDDVGAAHELGRTACDLRAGGLVGFIVEIGARTRHPTRPGRRSPA